MPMDLKTYLQDMESREQTSRSVLDRSVSRLRHIGFELEEPPADVGGRVIIPRIPASGISSLTDRELRDLHGEFIEILAYAQEQAKIQKILAEEYTVEADRVQRMVKLTLEGPANVRDDKSRVHKKVVALKAKASECDATFQMLLVKVEKFDNGKKACSRDVEFRTRELDSERRDRAIGSIKKSRRRRPTQDDLEV